MIRTDIVIVGAGAAGLMVARELARAGKKIIVLEARNRIGGRIHTFSGKDFNKQLIEAGAEFIHGDLPVTMRLVEEAGIQLYKSEGQTWRSDHKGIHQQDFFINGWDLLLDRLKQQQNDMSIAEFLQENFSGEEYKLLRNSVIGFVEGYDAADTHKANIFALRDEWMNEDDSNQYRLVGGYGKLLDYLESTCVKLNVNICLSSPVHTIKWEKDRVEVLTENELFIADKVIVTIPVGVLKEAPLNGGIAFMPPLPEVIAAANEIGFGSVIKFLAFFKESFWENYKSSEGETVKLEEVNFIFSDAEIPTWWTQFPELSNLLTGWLAGPNADQRKNTPIDELENLAIKSLARIFKLSEEAIKKMLVRIEVVNWAVDSWTKGAYAYSTLNSVNARAILTNPVQNTIYFAGEALYEGAAIGTVEAALSSGLHTAKMIS